MSSNPRNLVYKSGMKIVSYVFLNVNTARLKYDIVIVLPQPACAVYLVMDGWDNNKNVWFPMHAQRCPINALTPSDVNRFVYRLRSLKQIRKQTASSVKLQYRINCYLTIPSCPHGVVQSCFICRVSWPKCVSSDSSLVYHTITNNCFVFVCRLMLPY